MNLKKGIALVFAANVINAVFNLLTNFLLPKYLTVDAYAQIKTFQLYMGYVGILHFGYSDGMYLRYGGADHRLIDRESLLKDASTMRSFQLIIMVLGIVLGMILKNPLLVLCAVSVFPYNMIDYFKSYYRATGMFKRYSRILNGMVAFTFAINIILLALNMHTEYYVYVLCYVAVYIAVWLISERLLAQDLQQTVSLKWFSFDTDRFVGNIRSGFFLMIGNFSSIILTGMDRWFVKALMDTPAFAMYSFAVSVEGIMNVAVTPISTTLYNYFCNHQERDQIASIRGKVAVFSVFVVASVFPAKWILEHFLPRYVDSYQVAFWLFAAQIFYIVIKSVHVNLYKAQKRQQIYFKKLSLVLVAGFVFNILVYSVWSVKEAFAVGTFMCAVLWFGLCLADHGFDASVKKMCVYLFMSAGALLLCGFMLPTIPGCVVYCAYAVIASVWLMRSDVMDIFYMVKGAFKHYSHAGKGDKM